MSDDATSDGTTTDDTTTGTGADEPVVELLDQVWASIQDLIEPFDEATFALPSPLPGWTVQDCVSHIIGTERSLLGDPPPSVEVSHLPHVDSGFKEFVEIWIEERRSLTGAEVRAELDEVVPRRLEQLRAMPTARFEEVGWSPIGEVPYREFMRVRIFDSWMHEQDIRRAVGHAGHERGPVVDSALGNITKALGFIVGKRAGAPDGTSVVFRTTGGNEIERVVVVDGRASVVDTAPVDTTVVLTMPFATFVALAGGRIDADAAIAEGATITGDEALGRRVLDNMAFTP